jgi:surfactin synthase thioesterase subunit
VESANSQSSTSLNTQASPGRDERTALDPVDTVNAVVAPLDNAIQPVTKQPLIQPATQPAMAMLTSLLPIG